MRRTMTEQQLEQIAALRKENYPYSFIGRELGLSPNTVKSICQRKGFAASGARKTKAEKQNAPLCRYCHKPLPETKRRGALFCSDYCRTKAGNKAAGSAVLLRLLPHQMVPGKPESYGDQDLTSPGKRVMNGGRR